MWCSLVGLFMGWRAWSWIVPDSLREIARPLIPEDRVRPQGRRAAERQRDDARDQDRARRLGHMPTPPLNPRRSIQLNRP